jgi:hypothetical protein
MKDKKTHDYKWVSNDICDYCARTVDTKECRSCTSVNGLKGFIGREVILREELQ